MQGRIVVKKDKKFEICQATLDVNKSGFNCFNNCDLICVVICFLLLIKTLILKPGHVQSCNRKVLTNIFKRRIKEEEPKPMAEIEPERAPVKFSNYTENNLKKRT